MNTWQNLAERDLFLASWRRHYADGIRGFNNLWRWSMLDVEEVRR